MPPPSLQDTPLPIHPLATPLFFVHIPKAAGTSLRLALEEALGERLVHLYDDHPGCRAGQVMSRDLPEASVIYGHYNVGIHRRFRQPPRYATVVRPPVERVLSWYNFQGSNPSLAYHDTVRQTPLPELLKANTFKELSNHMTGMIAGRKPRSLEDQETLDLAKTRLLSHFEFVSTTTHLAEDFPALEALLGISLPPLPRVNVTPASPHGAHLNACEEVIRAYNLLDIELYDFILSMRLHIKNPSWPDFYRNIPMMPTFTAHNIRLENGQTTRPDIPDTMETDLRFQAARRVLETVFPGDKRRLRLADLGCLEGGYAVEFARMGFQVLGLEVRDSNIAACHYVKNHTNLPNLTFVQDDVWNITRHGHFDAVFCCGLLYHLDRPSAFLNQLAAVTTKLVILQTHFAPSTEGNTDGDLRYPLSEPASHEGLEGRWYTEFEQEPTAVQRDEAKWSSWENFQSFWPRREFLLQAIRNAGFNLVLEQFDSLGPNIAESLLTGEYRTDCRGTFIGIKT